MQLFLQEVAPIPFFFPPNADREGPFFFPSFLLASDIKRASSLFEGRRTSTIFSPGRELGKWRLFSFFFPLKESYMSFFFPPSNAVPGYLSFNNFLPPRLKTSQP